MVSKDEAVQLLTQLGLTLSQAKVYFALARSGVSTAKDISKVSEVAREHVYEIMPRLQDLSLVRKELTVPARFRSIPMQEGLTILMERKIRETSELHTKTTALIKNFRNNTKPTRQQEESQFAMISGREALMLSAKRAVEKAQTSIDYVTSSKKFFPWLLSQEELYRKAVERGVKIRLIIEKPEDTQSLPNVLQSLKKDSSMRIKYVPTVPTFRMGIYDRKDLYINTSAAAVATPSPALWTNNPGLLTALQDYFEISWITAMEE